MSLFFLRNGSCCVETSIVVASFGDTKRECCVPPSYLLYFSHHFLKFRSPFVISSSVDQSTLGSTSVEQPFRIDLPEYFLSD
jgi:hypothetical protein